MQRHVDSTKLEKFDTSLYLARVAIISSKYSANQMKINLLRRYLEFLFSMLEFRCT